MNKEKEAERRSVVQHRLAIFKERASSILKQRTIEEKHAALESHRRRTEETNYSAFD